MNIKTYTERRLELLRRMGEGGIAIIPTAKEYGRTPGIPFPFRPDSNFLYLSGFLEPNAVIVLFDDKSILFCQEKNPETKIWTGDVLGPKGAVNNLGFDEAYGIENLDEKILEFLKTAPRIFYPVARDETLAWDIRVLGWVRKSRTRDIPSKPEMFNIAPFIAEMRLIKDEEEIETMKNVIWISALAHKHLISSVGKGDSYTEKTIETEFHRHVLSHNFNPLHAYPIIAAAGKNACVLHSTRNIDMLGDGDLVLVDAGAESDDGYAADITRTFPVNGNFTKPQALLYQVVLDAQLAAIEQIRPKNTYQDPHIKAVRVITEGLVRLGILCGDVDYLIENELYKSYFPHRTSHWLGLDVHDVGDYKVNGEWRELLHGMVLTVEPGIYIQPDDMSVEEKWRGIGIRIEDDILVTENGYEVLSAAVPKEVDAIEYLMKN